VNLKRVFGLSRLLSFAFASHNLASCGESTLKSLDMVRKALSVECWVSGDLPFCLRCSMNVSNVAGY